MNYRLAFLAIFFWQLVSTGEVFFNCTKNSPAPENALEGNSTEATGRKPNAKPTTFSKKPLEASWRTYAHCVRLLLKKMRKWWHSHPVEVKLGKCFASYFNIKIPGLRRNEQFENDYDNPDGGGIPSKRPPTLEETLIELNTWQKPQEDTSEFDSFVFAKNIDLPHPSGRTTPECGCYLGEIFKNQMILCIWDYLVKKFWIWVDSAPES